LTFQEEAARRCTASSIDSSGSRAALVLVIGISWLAQVLNLLVVIVALFLMLIVLIQRGKGGGLAGAFGGPGGSSPFGSRAGDAFTRITITVAAIWVLLIMIQVKVIKPTHSDANVPQVGNNQ
jgi:preprotein translocase subunit SecG